MWWLLFACAGNEAAPTVAAPTAVPSTDAPAAASGGPSVVWISLDTVRADRLGVYGGPAATPTLDAFASGAAVYTRAFSHFPETGLSHWSMMTGVLPETHGNVPGAGDSAWTGPTAAELARARGYATGAFIGGITLTASATGLQRGFDVYDDQFTVDPADMKRDGDEVVRRAVAWMGQQTRPSFTFVHLFDAHFPYTPDDPRRYDRDYAGPLDGTDATLAPFRNAGKALDDASLRHVRALYDAELTELDATLAPLFKAVPQDAVVVITADHGESFEHGYLFNHRGSLGDGVLHVPLLIRGAGLAAGRSDALVGLVDVLPTVAALAGWELPGPVHGSSLVGQGAARERVWARTDPWMSEGVPDGPLLGLRTTDWKVVWGATSTRAWDLHADPSEDRAVAVPDALSGARDDYAALLEAVVARRRDVTQQRAPGAEEGAMLEALGYVAPSGGAAQTGGAAQAAPPSGATQPATGTVGPKGPPLPAGQPGGAPPPIVPGPARPQGPPLR